MAYRHYRDYGRDCGRNIEGTGYMALVERKDSEGVGMDCRSYDSDWDFAEMNLDCRSYERD